MGKNTGKIQACESQMTEIVCDKPSIRLYEGNCYDLIPSIPDGSIDLILTDVPYNMTACSWDQEPFDFEKFWLHHKRIIKKNGAIVMTASQPFTSKLVMSNEKMFKYCLVWEKSRPTLFLQASSRPMLSHEDIVIFYNELPIYNPQKWKIDDKYVDRRKSLNPRIQSGGQMDKVKNPRNKDTGFRYPFSIISCDSDWSKNMHPTQKPVALFEYLVRTYTNEGDTVFDGFGGSLTTAAACYKTNRNCIICEKDAKYFSAGRQHLLDEMKQGRINFLQYAK